MTERTEIWLPVIGHEGEYEVSSLGRVRSLDRVVWCSGPVKGTYQSVRKGRLLKPGQMNEYGHLSVAIGKNNSQCVHTLVAAAFHGPRPDGLDVCHRDGDAGNNAEDNVYYGTRSANNRDISSHDRRKLTVAQVKEVRARAQAGESGKALAREFGVCHSNMCYVVKGRYYAHI